jgi:hypothetical protein
MSYYDNFREKILQLQSQWGKFPIEFLNRDGFKKYEDNLYYNIYEREETAITGYFSETVRGHLEKYAKLKKHRIRLIVPELSLRYKRDQKNLQVLRNMAEGGVEIKVNNRIHARLLINWYPGSITRKNPHGILILGSFDFNTDCIGLERYDAGIKTEHPDLLLSAIEFFEQLWEQPESKPLDKAFS